MTTMPAERQTLAPGKTWATIPAWLFVGAWLGVTVLLGIMLGDPPASGLSADAAALKRTVGYLAGAAISTGAFGLYAAWRIVRVLESPK